MTGRFPQVRPRRLRATRHATTRRRDPAPPAELVLPMFIREGTASAIPISSMPGVQQHSLDSFRRALNEAAEQGVGGVNLFGVPTTKDAEGSARPTPTASSTSRSASRRKRWATHSSCSPTCASTSSPTTATAVCSRPTARSTTTRRSCATATWRWPAEAGAELVCMSGMMDGQIAAARDALDSAGTAAPRSWRTRRSTRARSTGRSARPWRRPAGRPPDLPDRRRRRSAGAPRGPARHRGGR